MNQPGILSETTQTNSSSLLIVASHTVAAVFSVVASGSRDLPFTAWRDQMQQGNTERHILHQGFASRVLHRPSGPRVILRVTNQTRVPLLEGAKSCGSVPSNHASELSRCFLETPSTVRSFEDKPISSQDVLLMTQGYLHTIEDDDFSHIENKDMVAVLSRSDVFKLTTSARSRSSATPSFSWAALKWQNRHERRYQNGECFSSRSG